MGPETEGDQTQEIVVQPTWRASELRRLALRRQGRRVGTRLVIWGLLVGLAVAQLGAGGWVLWVLWFLASVCQLAWKLVRGSRKALARPRSTMVFGPTGLVLAGEGIQVTLRWNRFGRVSVGHGCLSVFRSSGQEWAVPLRDITGSDLGRIAQMARAAGVPVEGFESGRGAENT